jgi:predicted phosphodiesterase
MAGLVQVISDVHCDVSGRQLYLDPTADTLVIAGDVCPYASAKYKDYIAALTANHRNVVYVPGNHEFYGASYDSNAIDYMERVCKSMGSNVVLLHNGGEHMDIPGTSVRIVGATMWTNIDPHLVDSLGTLLNDFTHIKYQGGFLDPSGMSELHAKDKEWVKKSVDAAKRAGKKALVVTHHSPDRRLSVFNAEKAKGGFGPLYYSSDLGNLTTNPNITAWIYGHTHEAGVFKLPDSPFSFVTNAKGYPAQQTGYADGFAINLKTRK